MQPPFLELNFCFKKEEVEVILNKIMAFMKSINVKFYEEKQDGKIWFNGWLGKEGYIISYLSNDDDYAILSILTEDIVFEPFHLFGGSKKESQRAGIKVYRKFRDISKYVLPLYACIEVEWRVETPFELKKDKGSVSFCDFYLDKKYYNDELKTLLNCPKTELYIEEVENGVYLSSTGFLNPKNRTLSIENMQKISKKVIENIIKYS